MTICGLGAPAGEAQRLWETKQGAASVDGELGRLPACRLPAEPCRRARSHLRGGSSRGLCTPAQGMARGSAARGLASSSGRLEHRVKASGGRGAARQSQQRVACSYPTRGAAEHLGCAAVWLTLRLRRAQLQHSERAGRAMPERESPCPEPGQ